MFPTFLSASCCTLQARSCAVRYIQESRINPNFLKKKNRFQPISNDPPRARAPQPTQSARASALIPTPLTGALPCCYTAGHKTSVSPVFVRVGSRQHIPTRQTAPGTGKEPNSAGRVSRAFVWALREQIRREAYSISRGDTQQGVETLSRP